MATKIVRYVSPKGIAMYPWVLTATRRRLKPTPLLVALK